MPTRKTNKIPFQVGDKKPINFSMRVIATDLPPEDDDFKIKLAINFVPEFVTDAEYTNTGFNGKRVKEIIQFVADEVITKVMEYIYYDRSIAKNIGDQGDNFKKALTIYNARRDTPIAKGSTLEEHKKKVTAYKEDEIHKIVTAFINKKNRKPSEREASVSSIRFEHMSPGKLIVSIDSTVNGEKKLPK